MENEDDSKAQVMFLDSSMNMKHNNCTVNINKSQRKIDFQVTGKSRCLCKHIKYPKGCLNNYYFVKNKQVS